MPDDFHQAVMVEEVLDGLAPRSGGRYADGTVGGGGHARAILEASGPDGWLLGCDRDPQAVEAARERLRAFAGRVELRIGDYADVFAERSEGSFDGVLLDLGVSSHQLERAERGFSFQREGPLDMRMNPEQTPTAAELLNRSSFEELVRIFRELGEVRPARRIARAVVEERRLAPIESTSRLARLIERVVGSGGRRIHPATQVFQALRMAVNRELESLEAGLAEGWRLLRRGGRMAVITFHSLEARLVKHFGRERARPYHVLGSEDRPEWREPKEPELRWVTRGAVLPSRHETERNPRSRSAQLRVFEKIIDTGHGA